MKSEDTIASPAHSIVGLAKTIAVVPKGGGIPQAGLSSFLEGSVPDKLRTLGNAEALAQPKLALFCSIKCPGSIILKTFDLMKELRDAGVTVISGFHSPMEQECLDILLRGNQPIIICPARSIETMRTRREFRKPLDDGKLLFLSPFPQKQNRVSAKRAEFRNRLVAALADRVLVPYAEPGRKTEQLCREIAESGKPLYTFETKHNESLLSLGARPFEVGFIATKESE